MSNGTNNQGINGYVAALATFTMSGMQTAYGSAWFGNEHVDLIATTQTVWDIPEDVPLKPRLIDLEAEMPTGRKQAIAAGHRERLSGGARASVMRQSDLAGNELQEAGRNDQPFSAGEITNLIIWNGLQGLVPACAPA